MNDSELMETKNLLSTTENSSLGKPLTLSDLDSILLSGSSYIDEINLYSFVGNLLIVFLLTYLVAIFYRRWGSSISDRNTFAKNFVLLGLITFLIITIVKSSLALSLGLIGALSIVRFRAAIKEPEELVYLFLVIGIGLGLGANQRIVTIVASVFILLLVYFSGRAKNQVTTDSLHRFSVVVPKNSLLTLDQITEILKEADSDVSVKRYERTVTGFEVMFAVRIPDITSLSTIQKGLDSLDENIELTILDARPII